MDIATKIRNFLERMQGLPDNNKKAILWTVVAIIVVIMGFFWIRGTIDKFSKLEIENIELPKIDISDMPALGGDKLFIQRTKGKIYKNDKYGFEIVYPEDWTFREYSSGAVFFPEKKLEQNKTGNGAISVGFYGKSSSYCKIPFDDYVKIAGPSEIQNYESLNKIDKSINFNGLLFYMAQWNYNDFQGLGKISLPITYFEADPELCGNFEIFLNDNNYLEIYNRTIFSFNLIK